MSQRLNLGKQLHEYLSSIEMRPHPFVNGIPEHFKHLDHGLDVEAMEAEGVPVCWLVEISAIHAVPDGDISADLGGHKLSKTTKTRRTLALPQSVDQVFRRMGSNWLEVLYFSLVDQVPYNCIVKVEIAKYLAASDQLRKGMIPNSNVRLVCSKRNSSKQSVLSEWVLYQPVCDLDSSKC